MMLDRLTAEDALVLGREAGAVCGHTCKVLILRSAGGRSLPELETLRRHIDARLDAAPRLRQRLVARRSEWQTLCGWTIRPSTSPVT